MTDWVAQLIAGWPFWLGLSFIVIAWVLYYFWDVLPIVNPKQEWWQDKAQRLERQHREKTKATKTRKG